MLLCDFCLSRKTELWGFPVAGFTDARGTLNVEGEFGICDDCRLLLDGRDVDGIIARVAEMNPGRFDSAGLADLRIFLASLLLNITGPMEKFREGSENDGQRSD